MSCSLFSEKTLSIYSKNREANDRREFVIDDYQLTPTENVFEGSDQAQWSRKYVVRGDYLYIQKKHQIAETFNKWRKSFILIIGSFIHRLAMIVIHLKKGMEMEGSFYENKKIQGECLRALRSFVGVIALPIIASFAFILGFFGLVEVGLDRFAMVERWINGQDQLFYEGKISKKKMLSVNWDGTFEEPFLDQPRRPNNPTVTWDMRYLGRCLQPQAVLDEEGRVKGEERWMIRDILKPVVFA